MEISTNFDRKLLDKLGDIKAALVKFGMQNFSEVLREKMEEAYGLRASFGLTDTERMRFIDGFLLQDILLDEETGAGFVIDFFLRDDSFGQNLSPKEKEVILNWRDNVSEGFFEIRQFNPQAEALVLYNLIDEMEYTVRSNIGKKGLESFKVGSYALTRLVPVEDYWIFSGGQATFPAYQKNTILREAAKLVRASPRFVYRNPEKLLKGWDAQRQDRAAFIAFFGSDMVVFPGNELKAKMQAQMRYRYYEWRGEGIDSTPTRQTNIEHFKESYPNKDYVIPEIDFPPEIKAADSVGAIYDEIEGLNYFVDFALFLEVFENPTLLNDQEGDHYDVVQGYLVADSISTLPFRRMIEQNRKNAEVVFNNMVKGERKFNIERDFEALMLQYKPEHVLLKKFPSVTMVPTHLLEALEKPAPAKLPRPTASEGWKRPPKSKKKK
jgi:hypothetical protein